MAKHVLNDDEYMTMKDKADRLSRCDPVAALWDGFRYGLGVGICLSALAGTVVLARYDLKPKIVQGVPQPSPYQKPPPDPAPAAPPTAPPTAPVTVPATPWMQSTTSPAQAAPYAVSIRYEGGTRYKLFTNEFHAEVELASPLMGLGEGRYETHIIPDRALMKIEGGKVTFDMSDRLGFGPGTP